MALAAAAIAPILVSIASAQQNPSSPPPTPRALTIPGQHAQANGVTTCLPVIDKLGRRIIADAPANAQSVWHVQDPDRRLFTTAIAADHAPAIGFITVTPGENGACDATLEQISYFAESCVGLRERGLAELQPNWQTRSVAAFLHPTGAAYYLIQAGTGCLVVIQEVRFVEPGAAAQ